MPNQNLDEELDKPIISKIEKWKACSYFIGNIWGAELADIQLSFDEFLACVIDIFIKY